MHFSPRSPVCRFVVLALAAGACLSAGAARYTLVDLGQRFPAAMNDHEDVAANNRTHAVILRDGRWHRLSDHQSFATAINGHGDVAGHNGARPMLWQRGKPERQLPLPDDGIFGVAAGINDRRTVIGLFEANDATIHCFQWMPNEGSTDIGFMAGGNFCQPFGVNDAGQITGEASTRPDPDRLPHAFVYDQGVFHDGEIVGVGRAPDGHAHGFLLRPE